jgi:hypothetical protein
VNGIYIYRGRAYEYEGDWEKRKREGNGKEIYGNGDIRYI